MKKRKVDTKVIGTHSGSFHCDEALACYLLKQLPEYADATIVRTRDPETIKSCDIVVDVGAVYDPDTCRFDHHQSTFKDSFSINHDIRLSSAGLIYKHFGRKVIVQVLKKYGVDAMLAEEELEMVYQKLYMDLIASVDGNDNGIYQYETVDGTQIKYNYKVKTDLPARVGRLNPRWNEKDISDSTRDAQFAKAIAITGEEFKDHVLGIVTSWLPARKLTADAFNSRFNHHPSGKILVMRECFPWKDQLLELEDDLGLKPDEKPLYALFPDSAGTWRVQTIPVDEYQSFSQRKSLPAPWKGIRDEELSKLSGIPGCIFVHASGFIGGNKTFEGALKMADVALNF